MAPYQFIERASPFNTKGGKTLPVFAVTPAHIETGMVDPVALEWAKKAGWKGDAGSLLLVPSETGHLGGALFGLGKTPSETPYISGRLARMLPAGDWHVETAPLTANRLLLGYGLGSYRFEKYKSSSAELPTLMMPADADAARIKRLLAGVFLARDLINTPTNDMGPDALESAFRDLASHYKAEVSVVRGDDLLQQNFPLIHA
ncbi:MAG: leucyl aminopeptidase family protein, partial [Alphaproteobacteria bacterium]